jgi:hypothetical protein
MLYDQQHILYDIQLTVVYKETSCSLLYFIVDTQSLTPHFTASNVAQLSMFDQIHGVLLRVRETSTIKRVPRVT